MPLSGIALRAFVSNWGYGAKLSEVLTLEHFQSVFDEPTLVRAIWNTILIGTVGGAIAVACYTAIGFATHRRNDGWSRFVDYLVLVPRAIPGLLAGLAFLWVFLFFPPLTPLRTTIFSMWLAYTVVWLAYGMRLISSSLLQVSTELEEAARSVGASRGQVSRDDHAAADPPRPARVVAAGVHDLRARVFDRRLPARAGHRGDRRRSWCRCGRAARSTSSPRCRSSTSCWSASASRSRCASACKLRD